MDITHYQAFTFDAVFFGVQLAFALLALVALINLAGFLGYKFLSSNSPRAAQAKPAVYPTYNLSRSTPELGLLHPASQCCVCGSKENIVTCHGCHQRDYCGIACQKLDRKLHRTMCLRKKDACEMCGKKKNLHSCSGCFQRQYCSPECQKEAWPEHKAICNAYKAIGLDATDPEEVVCKLSAYIHQLRNQLETKLRVSTEIVVLCKASKVKREHTLKAMFNLSRTLEQMTRYPEAETFAREMMAESEKETPIGEIHVLAVTKLCNVLFFQNRFEESRQLAHDGVERFRSLVPVGGALAQLMEVECNALTVGLQRHEEALTIQQYLLKTRLENPTLFENGGRVPFSLYYSMAESLMRLGRLDESEAMLKRGQATLESDGVELSQDVVHFMAALADVNRRQGRKREAAAMKKKVKKLVPQVFPKDHPSYKLYME
jgi:hypothetical protein